MRFPFEGTIKYHFRNLLIKILGRSVVEKRSSVTIFVPDHEAIELISYYDDFIDYYPNCELKTKRWFVENVGNDWVMLDCGANIGYFSILMARLAVDGYVYAFEPTCTYEMLNLNIDYNKLNNISTFKLGLGDKSGKYEEKISRIWGRGLEKKVYAFTTIDEFVAKNKFSRLDCIKIDVDSFDWEVLRGATEVLTKYNPYVIVELNHSLNIRGQSNTEALEWLALQGYKQAQVLDYDNFLLKREIDLFKDENVVSINIGYKRMRSM